MTVAELIALLQQLPQDQQVYIVNNDIRFVPTSVGAGQIVTRMQNERNIENVILLVQEKDVL